MERSQFTFYASFSTALSRIRNKAVRCAAYDAICAYALYGELPNMEALPDAAAIAFDLIRPTLDAAAKKAAAGKTKTKRKDTKNKTESKREDTVKEKEKEKENEKEKEGEKEREKENENECSLVDIYNAAPASQSAVSESKRKQTIPPARADVEAYCAEMGYTVNVDAWFAHYKSNGWKVGRNPMKDWRAAVQTWQHNGYDNAGGNQNAVPAAPAEAPRSQTSQIQRMIEQLEAKK